ncbi:MAG: sulfotransferase family 2 domain-containing protein [Cyanobacteria bacterium P01_B01_bin.77]
MLIKCNGDKKFIFVANKKCASTSIVNSNIAEIADIKLTSALVGRHMSIEEIYETFRFIFEKDNFGFNKFFKFGIIRDPLEWIISWYNFYSGLAHTEEMTFADFFHTKPHVAKPQSVFFISSKYESVKVDYLARYEYLMKDLSRIRKNLGLETLEIPTLNQSWDRKIFSHSIEKSLKQEIEERYRNDYDLIENLDLFNAKSLQLL